MDDIFFEVFYRRMVSMSVFPFSYISLKAAIDNIQQPNVILHVHKPMVYTFTYCIPHLYLLETIFMTNRQRDRQSIYIGSGVWLRWWLLEEREEWLCW